MEADESTFLINQLIDGFEKLRQDRDDLGFTNASEATVRKFRKVQAAGLLAPFPFHTASAIFSAPVPPIALTVGDHGP